jgi:hypothetical protein
MSVQRLIAETCDEVKTLLLKKNAEYGNAFAEPLHIFSSANADEQIRVRIDDKLKRLQTIKKKGIVEVIEDTEIDLIGYLILLRVNRKLVGEQNGKTEGRKEQTASACSGERSF